jgi:hypothetical protein
VKGKEAAVGQEGGACWDIIIKNDGKDLTEGLEEVLIGGLVRGGEAIGPKGVCETTERAVHGACFEGSQCLANNIRCVWLVTRTVTGVDSVAPADKGGGRGSDTGL